ncbi:MAG: hypothetical protein NC177_17925 [Ruminococcus flavefaciens]|nr:hypothetical protein [Ruminococcus flavefaciens]
MKDNEIQDIGEQVVKTKKRGSKSASAVATTTANSNEISKAISESFQYFKRPIVKTDEECAERLEAYFNQCTETGQLPTVEDMCLALGTVRRTVWDWQNGRGCSSTRTHMIKKAKEILAGIDAKLVLERKLPEVTYIFRAKNFFDMADKQEVVVTPNNPLGEETTQKELEDKYMASVVEADGRTVDE